MPFVEITGWSIGLQKVSHTEAIREYAGLSLTEAKKVTDTVLNGDAVILEIQSLADAEALVKRLVEIGAIAELKIH